MPLTNCPFCKAFASMEIIPESGTALKHDRHQLQAAYDCAGCGRLVIGLAMQSPSNMAFVDPNDPRSISTHLETLPDGAFRWEPANPIGRDFPDVPEVIAAPASEAYACASVGQYRASVMMARAVIEASAKHHEIDNRGILAKIDELVAQDKIRPLLGKAAHEIRIAGNNMAHGDFATVSISRDDAEDLLALMEDFLSELFQIPNRVAKRREKREASAAAQPL